MGDAGVRFISDTIDAGKSSHTNYAIGMTGLSGKSPYGVWGAMGSANGGESITLSFAKKISSTLQFSRVFSGGFSFWFRT